MTHYIFTPPPVVSLPIEGEPLQFPVNRIFCVGRNYADHAIEMGFAPTKDEPFFFDKPTACLTQSGCTLPIPPMTDDFHHEVELVVMLHSGGHNIAENDAYSHVYGYAVGFDMTRRDLQLKLRKDGKPWDFGKAFENAAIIGAITPCKNFGEVKKQIIELKVNGQTRQKADLSQLIFNISELIAYLSKFYTLQAGDILFTGTPAGVGPVVAGDELVGTVEGLPEVRVKYR